MKSFTIEDLRTFDPCYDPIKYLEEGKNYNVIDILDNDKIPFEDRLWVILRTDYLSERSMRLFAVWSARQVQHLMKDPRSIKALDVAESYANGNASSEELTAAQAAAWAAAWDAAWAAARAAARDAAQAAAQAAARAAARDAARDAAWAADWDAAWAAARAAQKNKLREMILAGIETGDTK